MKLLLVVSIFIFEVEGEADWPPIVGPLFSISPCQGSDNIVQWFEAGLEKKDNNRYYVYVKKAFEEDSKVSVQFDAPVNMTFTVRTDTSKYSRVSLTNGNAFTLRFFAPQSGLGFIVKGTQPGVTPYLQSFSVDDEEICDYPMEGFLEQYAADSIVKDMGACGRRMVDHSELIVSGEPSKPGDWPWHAALYWLQGYTMKYICGGTLLSKSFVLTARVNVPWLRTLRAAHCVSYRGAKYSADMFSVVLGKYTLYGDDKDSEEKEVLQIIIHEQFNYRRVHNDIALLKLKTEAVYSDYIQPACLLRSEDRSKLSGDQMSGTIVGWGFDGTGTLSRSLRQATMPIVSEATCLRSHIFFYDAALNENNFCAGYHNGTSACNGDSGSAFQVFIPDDLPGNGKNESGTWHVKGIVSNALARTHENVCDPEQYVVFTDVEKFLDWITQYTDQ